jgi:tricorn protease
MVVLCLPPSACPQLTTPQRPPLQGPRMPALSPDGQRLAFVYRGDIWTAPANGGEATPLTWHIEMDAYPVYSPDGAWVAFASKRQGSWDIFAIPAQGGAAQQLTFHGGEEIPTAWSPDGQQLLFASQRDAPNHGLFTLDVNTLHNGLLTEDYAPMHSPSWSPDGQKILYGRYGFHWTRPRYHGSAAAQVWLYDLGSKSARPLTASPRQHLWPRFLPDGTHFLVVTFGDETPSTSTLNQVIPKINDTPARTPNLWRFGLDGNGQQRTFFTGGAVRCPSVAARSGAVAFEYETDLWLLQPEQQTPEKIQLLAAVDEKQTTRQRETLADGVTEAQPSLDGKTFAFGLRGDIWTISIQKPKGVAGRNAEIARRLTDWVGEDTDFSWSQDGSKLYFTSDRQFNFRVFALNIETLQVEPVWNRSEDVTGLRLSPDGKQLTFWVSGPEGGLWLWTLATGAARRIVKVPGSHGHGGTYAWSPDQKWIAYSSQGESHAWNIWIVPVSGGAPVNITRLYAHHSQPIWSPDGKYLFFQSNREGDGLYVLPLAREPARADDTDIKFTKPTNQIEVVIHVDDISRRIRKLAGQSPQADLTVTPEGQILFLSQGDIWSVSYDGKEVRRLTSGGEKTQLRVSTDGRTLYFVQKGELWTISHDGKNPQKITFSADWERDLDAERQAAFTQFWRSYHLAFYDPNFHGRDWEAIRSRYEPRLAGVETREEFAALLQMMVGELETSHAEVKPAPGGPKAPVTPHLGFAVDYAHPGPGLKVGRVPDGAPASYPETQIKTGEFILAINGQTVRPDEHLYQLINDKQNREFEFRVNSRPDEEGSRTVKYKVLSQEEWSELNYQNRVEQLRQYVHAQSKGRIGYVHMSAMAPPNQIRFEREIYEYMIGKEAMIVDLRFNTGGNIADNLVDWLERKPHGFLRPRDRAPYYAPDRAWDKPIIVVMNEHSYSNAEIFAYAMRARHLARLVGQPTPGYVIWTDSLQLVNGTSARIPQSGFYRLDGSPQEGHGEVPDFLVPLPPADWLAGRDPQLDKALELLLADPTIP